MANLLHLISPARMNFILPVFLWWSVSLKADCANPVPTGAPATYPAWWFERGIISAKPPIVLNPHWPEDYLIADDHAAANSGQLKAMAVAAYDEMEARLDGGAGVAVKAVICGFFESSTGGNGAIPTTSERIPRVTGSDNFATITIGQVKEIARPFYERLIQIGLISTLPWLSNASGADDYAVVNIGQLKNLFAFDISSDSLDSDGDGIPDSEALQLGGGPFNLSAPGIRMRATGYTDP